MAQVIEVLIGGSWYHAQVSQDATQLHVRPSADRPFVVDRGTYEERPVPDDEIGPPSSPNDNPDRTGIVTADIYRGTNITPGPVDYVGDGRRKHRRGLR